MIRIAAVGDLHFGRDSRGTYRPSLAHLAERADVLLVAGDLTRWGDPEEAHALADELEDLPVPAVAVLGNHDYQSGREDDVRAIIEDAGVRVLEGEATVLETGSLRLGIAGSVGFGGGFAGRHATDFGEPEMKAFVARTARLARGLERALSSVEADVQVALMHYAPIRETLEGEPPELNAFLGSYLLGEAVDTGGADLAIHGHAHRGAEKGTTPGGVPVRNVAWPVIGKAYALYELQARDRFGSEREQLVR